MDINEIRWLKKNCTLSASVIDYQTLRAQKWRSIEEKMDYEKEGIGLDEKNNEILKKQLNHSTECLIDGLLFYL